VRYLKQATVFIIIAVFLCPVSLFADQAEILQLKMDATVWELNYCRQRALVLQFQAQDFQKQIRALTAAAKREAKKALEKQEGAKDAPSDQ